MRTPPRTRLLVIALCPLVACGIAACGGTIETEAPGATSLGGSSAPASGAASTSPTPAEPSSSAATPTVKPATGRLVTGIQVTLRAPRGWRVTQGEADWQSAFDSEDLGAEGELLEHPGAAGRATPSTLTAMVKDWEAVSSPGIRWRRLPDVVIAGLPAYHIRGTESGGIAEDQYGTALNHRDLVIDFVWETEWSRPAQRQRIADQILASVTRR